MWTFIFIWWLIGLVGCFANDYFTRENVTIKNLFIYCLLSVFGPFIWIITIAIFIDEKDIGDKVIFRWERD